MEGYSSNMLCTYLNFPIENQQALYSIQFFQVMKIKSWDDDIINNKTEQLMSFINKFFNNNNNINIEKYNINVIINKLRDLENNFIISLFGNSDLTIFRLLFQIDYFQYAHHYFCLIIKLNDFISSCNDKDKDNFFLQELDLLINKLEKAFNILYNNIK